MTKEDGRNDIPQSTTPAEAGDLEERFKNFIVAIDKELPPANVATDEEVNEFVWRFLDFIRNECAAAKQRGYARGAAEGAKAATEKAIALIKKRWTFNAAQRHTHSWHDMADVVELLEAARADDVTKLEKDV